MAAQNLVEIAPSGVMAREIWRGSRVSSETLMRRTPQIPQTRWRKRAKFASPLVVSVSLIKRARYRDGGDSERTRRTSRCAAPAVLPAGQPQLSHGPLAMERRTKPVELFEREASRPWAEKVMSSDHAIKSRPQIAAIP